MLPEQFDARVRRLADALADRFTFEAVIGRSRNATVIRVSNQRLQRLEVLKLLSDWSLADPDYAVRFIQEARLAASLDHPNIVKVFDFADTEGLLWYTMRLVDGPDLAATLAACGPLDSVAVARLCVPLLDALAYSHARGVVHRDIKPSNIFLDSSGRPHLSDFGVAKVEASVHHTQTGQVLGTPAYLAPEQAQGGAVDGRTDLYALGVTLYELLAGRYPFATDDALQSIIMRITTDPDPLLLRQPDVHPHLAAMVMRAIRREPDDRFPNAAAMRAEAEAVERELCGERTGTAPTRELADLWVAATAAGRSTAGLWEQRPTWTLPGGATARARRMRWRAGGALIVAALAVGAALAIRGGRRTPTPPAGTAPRVVAPAASVPATPTPGPPPATPFAAPTGPAPQAGGQVPAPSRPATHQRVQVDEQAEEGPPVRMPRLIERVPPELPENLVATCQGEIVDLSLDIGADGSVSAARVLAARRPECAEAALAAARQYAYEPAVDRRGRPVAATVAVALQF